MQGFDEYMNMVLDEAEEVHMRKNHRKPLGDHAVFMLWAGLHVQLLMHTCLLLQGASC